MPDIGETIKDGQFDWSGGVDSGSVPTIQSNLIPNGLGRNQLAWLDNGIVRGGGITQRAGWIDLGKVHDGKALFQGAEVYEADTGSPYLMASIGGDIYQVLPDYLHLTKNLSATFGAHNPTALTQSWFCQGEQFMIIQAGDGITLPLFWDGATLRRSNGITGSTLKGDPNINELPAARAMDYYAGRLWYAQGRKYTAGDIVKGANGTAPYGFLDSILKVTENPLAIGGDGFRVPTKAGDIRALKHAANMDNALGESELFVFTRKSVFRLNVPVTRAEWTNAKEPLQKVVQKVNGSVNDRSVVAVNGDLYYQSLEPGIRSLAVAVRNFGQPGNVIISANIERIMRAQDRGLMHASSGIYFDNRLWQTVLPYDTTDVGIASKGVAPMDFDPDGNLQKKLPPVWEGIYEGRDILQLLVADFDGRERAFAFVRQQEDGSIHLWELTIGHRFERDDDRVTWIVTFPAYTWGREFDLKKLVSGELFWDRMFGEVDFKMYYRPDSDNCWYLWHAWKECSARTSSEDFFAEDIYPPTERGENYVFSRTLPLPQPVCQAKQGRPTNVGYQFQCRLVIRGFCRIRGFLEHAEKVSKPLYASMANYK